MPLHRSSRTGRPARLALAALLALAATAGGCSRPPGKNLLAGSYRAVLELPGGRELPFGLDVAREEHGPVLYLLNGEERTRLHEVEAGPGQLRVRVPGHETTLVATISGGDLAGSVTLQSGGRPLELPFRAKLGDLWRFERKPLSDNADVAGRWELRFDGAEGPQARAVAELSQQFHEVTGTVATAAGTEGPIAGEIRDERVRLSRFDGGSALLYEAELDGRGDLRGEAWSDRDGLRRFTARRNPDADAAALVPQTRVRASGAPLQFSARDLDGRTVAADDPAFAGKALVVSLTSSGSPDAHDQAPVLVELDRRYRGRGLAVVALMFEPHAEFPRAVEAVRRFRAAHGVEFATLVAGQADARAAAAALPQLEVLGAYPTTLFVDRGGRVRGVLTGFPGPAAGVRHDRLVQAYHDAVESLLGPVPD